MPTTSNWTRSSSSYGWRQARKYAPRVTRRCVCRNPIQPNQPACARCLPLVPADLLAEFRRTRSLSPAEQITAEAAIDQYLAVFRATGGQPT